MSRKSWTLIGMLLVALPLILVLLYHFTNKKPNPLSLVPQHAAMVWHITGFPEKWEKFRNDNLWKNLKSGHNYFKDLDKRMQLMDLLLSKDSLNRNYPDKIIASFHTTATDQFDVLFFIALSGDGEKQTFASIIDELKTEGKYRLDKRIFNDYEIHEIIPDKERSGFSYILYKDILVGSFTGFLIEDVVRVIEDEARPFRSKINTAASETGEALIQVNYTQLPAFIGAFAKKEYKPALDGLLLFADYSIGDGHYNKDQVLFSGYTYGNRYSYLSCFQGQAATKSWIRKYLSTNAGMLYYFGFDNGKRLNQALEQYWQLNNDSMQLKSRSKLRKISSTFIDSFSELLGKEMVLALIESPDTDKIDKALYIHSYKPEELLEELSAYAEKQPGKKTIFKEQYKKYIIRELPVADFPHKMWGSVFTGFDHCFYTLADHYVIISSSLTGLKSLLNDIDSENVWQRSVALNSYLEEALSESNVSLLINTKRSISCISDCMGDKYSEKFLNSSGFWTHIPFVAFQFNNSDNRFYTNFIFRHDLKGVVASKESDKSERVVKEVLLPYKITGAPALFNTAKKSTILVKDSLAVYLFSQDGWIQWKDSVKAPLIGKTYSGDLNKDGTNDYIFASKEKLYAVSGKDGRNLPGFPVIAPQGSTIHTLSLIDYDNNRNYRILTSDHLGNIYMYDGKGMNLEGWAPRKLTRKLVSEARHTRVLGKDMIVAVQEDGKINVLNRRGQFYPGFPVKAPESLVSDYFVKVGSDFSNSAVIVLTKSGQLWRINLKGEITEKKQIYRPASEVVFSLVPDQKKASFVLVRQALGKTEILDEEEKLLLEREGAYNSRELVTYFNYGADHQYFIVTDVNNFKTVVFNGLGKQLNKKPVESTYPPAVKENEPKDKFLLFSVNNRKFSVKGYR